MTVQSAERSSSTGELNREHCVEMNNLKMDWVAMEAPRPNAKHYSLICSLAEDVPLPDLESDNAED